MSEHVGFDLVVLSNQKYIQGVWDGRYGGGLAHMVEVLSYI
jgi:hypothetical protein